jgi:hypothetical protein
MKREGGKKRQPIRGGAYEAFQPLRSGSRGFTAIGNRTTKQQKAKKKQINKKKTEKRNGDIKNNASS